MRIGYCPVDGMKCFHKGLCRVGECPWLSEKELKEYERRKERDEVEE